jgi:hypothetical protein
VFLLSILLFLQNVLPLRRGPRLKLPQRLRLMPRLTLTGGLLEKLSDKRTSRPLVSDSRPRKSVSDEDRPTGLALFGLLMLLLCHPLLLHLLVLEVSVAD